MFLNSSVEDFFKGKKELIKEALDVFYQITVNLTCYIDIIKNTGKITKKYFLICPEETLQTF